MVAVNSTQLRADISTKNTQTVSQTTKKHHFLKKKNNEQNNQTTK